MAVQPKEEKRVSIFDRALSWFIRQRGYSLVAVDAVAHGMLRTMGRPSDQNIMQAYAESPWLHIKMVRLASSMAGLGWKVGFEDESGKFQDVRKTHPFVRLWNRPNPFLRGWDFRFLTELWVRCVGSCYWWLSRDGLGTPNQILFIPSTWAQPVMNRGRLEMWRVRDPFNPGNVVPVRPRDFIWIRTPDPMEPYMKGLGDALSLATEIDTYELASESDRKFFHNDATPPGALVVPGRPSKEEVDRIQDDWQEKVGGPQRAGSVPVLWGGLDFKQFRQGRKEMDYIEGQRFLRDVIISGVHKHILGVSEDVNFANAKAAEFTYGRWELEPRVPWWEEQGTMVAAEFDERLMLKLDSPVPQDEELNARKANEALARGAIKRGEYRGIVFPELEELPPAEANVYVVPLTLVEHAPGEHPTEEKPPEDEERPPEDEEKPKPAPGPGQQQFEPTPAKPARLTRQEIDQILDRIDDEETREQLEEVYLAVIEARVSLVSGELGLGIDFAIPDARVLQWIVDEAGKHIRGINDTTREKVRDALLQGTAAGEGMSDIADRVSEIFSAAKGPRSEMIARTETIAASNWAADQAYKESGVVVMKEWLLAPDYDPAQDDGQCEEVAESGPVPLDEKFEGGFAFPPAHINCRCAIAPLTEAAAEEEGKAVLVFNGKRLHRVWYDPVQRQNHITAMGIQHMQLERRFQGRLKRIFQVQQNKILRLMRSMSQS